MRIRVLGCYGSESHGQHSSGFLINGRIALEAGALTSALTEQEQLCITNILVSHAHLDHTKELIFLVDNFFLHEARGLKLMGIPDVVAQMRRHLFNDQLWPDFTRIPASGEPVLVIESLKEDADNLVDDLRVHPVRVDHTVPAAGYIIRDAHSAIAYSGDTRPTELLWKRAREVKELKAVFVECSFPDVRKELALESGHLTPSLLKEELAKLGRPEVPIYITHIKPSFAAQIARELTSLEGYLIAPLVQGESYSW